MYYTVVLLITFLAYGNALPIGETSSATSYVTANFGYKEVASDNGLGIVGQNIAYVQKAPILYNSQDNYDAHSPAKYEFHYAVADEHSGDYKSHSETRDGDVVKGEYSLKEADGTTRTVKYTVDKKSGFNAVVTRSGHAAHPQVQVKKVAVPLIVSHNQAPNYYNNY